MIVRDDIAVADAADLEARRRVEGLLTVRDRDEELGVVLGVEAAAVGLQLADGDAPEPCEAAESMSGYRRGARRSGRRTGARGDLEARALDLEPRGVIAAGALGSGGGAS